MKLDRVLRFLRGLKSPSDYLAVYFREAELPADRVCVTCAHVGAPVRQLAGRADVERAIWFILILVAIVYVVDMVLLRFTDFFLVRWTFKLSSMAGKVFAVLSMAYTVIRVSIRTSACAKCGGTEVIPLDSPRGRSLVENQKRTP